MPEAPIQAIEAWFARHAWTPFDFQRNVWNAYLNGGSGLVHAATGTGKTYAAWLGPLMEWMGEQPDPATWIKRRPPLRVLWITPLRALAADTAEALALPLRELGLPWSLESRTGDTTATVRNRQRQRLPTALVTTPESLSLFLTRADAADLFGDLRAVIVDEWHELLASKRGVQTELALARLRHWRPDLRVWGLSATLGNLDTALSTLLGTATPGQIIRGVVPKVLKVAAIIPPSIERFPWAGHLGTTLLPQVLAVIEGGRSALIFTNTRSQTEIWYQAILNARPEWAGEIALHHGSLDRKVRDWVETALRNGQLRCVVSTSSLDLGVDFSPVDTVLQIGCPKSVARLLQRAGRSGHSPGLESRIICVPTHDFELIEVAAIRRVILAGAIESRIPFECPLDVLVQHLVTIALGGGFEADALYAEIRTTNAFRDLQPDEWTWSLDFVTRGGDALQNYPEYKRVVIQNGRYVVLDREVARFHRLSIGTITSDAALKVQYLKGRSLGTIEESFIARLRQGDHFVFAGKILEFVRVRDMTAWVRKATGRSRLVPRWYGGRLPLSSELAAAVRAELERAREGIFESIEMQAVRPILELQMKWSAIPAQNELLIERVKTREGHHLFIYPFEGRLVHEGLAALFAYRLARHRPISFTMAMSDYGFELLSPDAPPLEEALAAGLLEPVNLVEDIAASLNATEMARRQFREIARIAGLVFQGYPGQHKTTKQVQASSGLLYDVFARYDSGNKLLAQASREVLERQLERSRLGRTLERLAASHVRILNVPRPTPFAFP